MKVFSIAAASGKHDISVGPMSAGVLTVRHFAEHASRGCRSLVFFSADLFTKLGWRADCNQVP
jgi:hypothetical protein